MPVPQEREEWTAKVYGAVSGRPLPGATIPLTETWTASAKALTGALDSVNLQLMALRVALLKSGDQDLRDIADVGLDDVLMDHPRRLRTTLRTVQGTTGDGRRKALTTLAEALDGMQRHLRSSRLVAAVDDNPMRVTARLRGTLDQPLLALTRQTRLALQGGG